MRWLPLLALVLFTACQTAAPNPVSPPTSTPTASSTVKPPPSPTAIPSNPPPTLAFTPTVTPNAPKSLLAFDVAAGDVIALINGRVIDGTGVSSYSSWTILIQGDRIIGAGPDIAVPAEAVVVDASGQTILPGLFDMHGHLYTYDGEILGSQFLAFPPLYLAGGVTTLFTAGDFNPQGSIALAKRVELGQAVGPHILAAGPYFTSGSNAASWMFSSSSVEATLAEYNLWRTQISGLKVYTGITEEQLSALIQAAHADGLPVTGHLASVTAARAIELGIDGIEHGIFSMSEFWPKGANQNAQYCALAELDITSATVQALIDSIIAHKVYLDPTLVVFQPELSDFEPLVANWEDYVVLRVRPSVQRALRSIRLQDDSCLRRALENQAQFVKAVHDRGGVILAGSDPGLPVLTPGYGLQRELQNLVDAGLTPLEAIRAAAYDSATVMGLENDRGSIAVGQRADLVLVEGRPDENITAVGNTVLVFKDGLPYDPAALRQSVLGLIGSIQD